MSGRNKCGETAGQRFHDGVQGGGRVEVGGGVVGLGTKATNTRELVEFWLPVLTVFKSPAICARGDLRRVCLTCRTQPCTNTDQGRSERRSGLRQSQIFPCSPSCWCRAGAIHKSVRSHPNTASHSHFRALEVLKPRTGQRFQTFGAVCPQMHIAPLAPNVLRFDGETAQKPCRAKHTTRTVAP